nr:hypothetical protein [uncultured Bacillus sp.]
MENKQRDDGLEYEWIQLLEELIQSGVTKETFRAFLDIKKAEKEGSGVYHDTPLS